MLNGDRTKRAAFSGSVSRRAFAVP